MKSVCAVRRILGYARGNLAKPQLSPILSSASWGAATSRALSSQASVPAALVKQLRDRTGASMGKCRQALGEEEGDLEKAVDWLRRRGVKSMEKRATDAVEAMLGLNVAGDGRSAAVVELRCETDFVTRSGPFQELALSLAEVASKLTSSKEESLVEDLVASTMSDVATRPKQIAADTTVNAALLELASVLGERLVMGNVWRLHASDGPGAVAGYVHPKFSDGVANTGRMAAIVAVRPIPKNSEPLSDATQVRTRAVANQLARHIVAAQPQFVSVSCVPASVLNKERETMLAAHMESLGARKQGSLDEKVKARVLDGKTQKWYNESVLLCQELIAPGASADGKAVPVSEWLEMQSKEMGLETIIVENFRFASL